MPDFEQDLERIQSALATRDSDLDEIGLDEIAARYASECRDVNQRLHRCGNLLKKGLLAEAIQQAQLSPPILDQFALLDFPERDEWVSYAQENSLQVPPPLQTKVAVELNHAFAEAETMKECLCRHRLLALAHAPIRRRLSVMWRLAKLDPMNPVWMKDLRQFERVRIREIENELHEATRNDDSDRVESLFKEVTYPHWTELPSPSLVNQVKSAWGKYTTKEARGELADLEEKLTAAVMAGDKTKAKGYYDKAVRLKKDAGLPGSNPLRQRLDLALEWVEEQEQREIRREEWEVDCEHLSDAIQSGNSLVELDRLKQQVLAYGMGIPEDLENCLDQLHRKKRRRKLIMWCLLVLIAPMPIYFIAIPVGYKYWQLNPPGNNDKTPVNPGGNKDKNPVQPPIPVNQNAALRDEVRTILRDNCFSCHGGDKKKTSKNDLKNILSHSLLITKEASEPSGKKYVVPRQPDESAIWIRVLNDSMPQGGKEKKLTLQQKEKLKNWIAQGALSLD